MSWPNRSSDLESATQYTDGRDRGQNILFVPIENDLSERVRAPDDVV
jgi:hypothetical protein